MHAEQKNEIKDQISLLQSRKYTHMYRYTYILYIYMYRNSYAYISIKLNILTFSKKMGK